MATLKEAVRTAVTNNKYNDTNNQTAAVPTTPTPRTATVETIEDFFPDNPPTVRIQPVQPRPTTARARARRFNKPNFSLRQDESRVMKIGGALFLLAFAGFIWLLSESTTLAIPHIFTNALDLEPWKYLIWIPLLAMSFLIVAHKPHPGLLTIKDLWWVAFTLADVGTTFLKMTDLAAQKAAIQHIPVVVGTLNWFIMWTICFLLAVFAVFAPISTMREAIRLIRWEI